MTDFSDMSNPDGIDHERKWKQLYGRRVRTGSDGLIHYISNAFGGPEAGWVEIYHDDPREPALRFSVRWDRLQALLTNEDANCFACLAK